MSTKLDYYNLATSAQSAYEAPTITAVYVTDSTYLPPIGGNISATNGSYVKIIGNDLVNGAQVVVKTGGMGGLTQNATTVVYTSQQEIDAFLPLSTSGSKTLYVVNPNGFTSATIINYS